MNIQVNITIRQVLRSLSSTSRDSIAVSIPACHAGDPGSIPGRGAPFVFVSLVIIQIVLLFVIIQIIQSFCFRAPFVLVSLSSFELGELVDPSSVGRRGVTPKLKPDSKISLNHANLNLVDLCRICGLW